MDRVKEYKHRNKGRVNGDIFLTRISAAYGMEPDVPNRSQYVFSHYVSCNRKMNIVEK